MAVIADIQHCSVHDGPGIRTTVFLKGCPLHCVWCHNPECISFQPEILHYPEKCIGCGQCAKGCFSGAQVLCGTERTVENVMEDIRQDHPYYGKEGGVTLSGGEPLAQSEFTESLARACRAEQIHFAVETSLYASWEIAEPILRLCNLVMTDLKIWDPELHKSLTGVSNEKIIDNIRHLDEIGVIYILRTPVIDGVNDGEVASIFDFAKTLKNLLYYELLPYHPLGESKNRALGKEIHTFRIPANEKLQMLAQINGPEIRIAGRRMNKLC